MMKQCPLCQYEFLDVSSIQPNDVCPSCSINFKEQEENERERGNIAAIHADALSEFDAEQHASNQKWSERYRCMVPCWSE